MIENGEFAAFTRRVLRAMARRAGGDVELLPELQRMRNTIDEAMTAAVAACRAEGYSWGEIAQRLGTTRQAAQQRYGRPEPRSSKRRQPAIDGAAPAARRCAAVVALLAVGLSVLAAPAGAAQRRTIACPQFGAHRGEGWPAATTGDSRVAVQAAIDDPGATFLESDVWATSDGLGLMQHSNSLPESTDGLGLVSDHTLDEIQTTMHMHDGTAPESLPEFLAQVVGAHKHAVLHDKSASLDSYVDAQMRAAHAHPYVRVMVATIREARWFHDRGWIVEYTPPARAPRAGEVAAAKAAGVSSVLIVDTSRKATPGNRFTPWIAARVQTDYVTYSAAQDATATHYAITRLMSGDLAQSRAVEACAVAS